jgi:hypothetical protein
MIKYTEYGINLHYTLHDAGYVFSNNDNTECSDLNGNQSPEIDAAVQVIIDSYSPLPEAQAEAIERINIKAGEARAKHVTSVPSQNETYRMKLEDAKAFKKSGCPEYLIEEYPFISREAAALRSSGQEAASLIIRTSNAWTYLASVIEGERRQACEDIKRCELWGDCSVLADTAIAKLEEM